jgi:YHS domain-containing protein
MIKVVLYLFLIIILISVLRSVIGILGKAFSGFLSGDGSGHTASSEPRISGELKRDPVCGTFVSTDTSVKRTIAGQTVHFCSESCSARYAKG